MGATVLVVEDDEQVRALVVTILKKHDFVVIEATNAWQALAALQRPPVDLVILDLRMPYSISGSDLIGTM
ncbi:MAG: response regulator [Candidatus Latescibacteria bacterium]|jgi:DNA-binding response OmpR family regulator|nr:response regulator [Candidatus Latescibacterota bacterium]